MTLERPILTTPLTSELTVADRRQKREIRQLEQELHKWQVLVDSITGEEARGAGGSWLNSLRTPWAHPISQSDFSTVVPRGGLFPDMTCPSTGMSSPDFDNQTLAVLRGRMVRYLMRSREVRPCSPSSSCLPRFLSIRLPHTALSVSGP